MKKSLKKYIITGIFLITGILVLLAITSKTKVYALDEHIHSTIHYTPWTNTNSLPTSEGYYFLENDVALSETVEIKISNTQKITLCLNGHAIKMTGKGNVFKVTSGLIEIDDCQETEHKYKINEEKLAVVDDTLDPNAEGVKTFKGGYITGGNGVETGGAFYVNGGAVFLRKSVIIGNKTTGNGGAIYIEKSSDNTVIEKSLIIGNVAEKGAGGIYNAEESKRTFVRSFSKIKDNVSKESPAGIYAVGSLELGNDRFQDEIYIYDNICNGKEDDLSADGNFEVSAVFTDNSKIGFTNLKRGLIINYFKSYRILKDDKYVDLYNKENVNEVFISNSGIKLAISGNNAVYEYNALDYVIAYDEDPHAFKPDLNYKPEHTIKYGTEAGTYDLETSPEFTEIGEYTIYYVVNIGDILVKEGTQKITITEIDPHMPTGNKNLIYTGNAQELITVTEYPGISYNYKLKDGYWSTYIPKGLDIGTYTVYVRIYGDTEHGFIEQIVKATIIAPDKTEINALIAEAKEYEEQIKNNYRPVARELDRKIRTIELSLALSSVTSGDIEDKKTELEDAVNQAKTSVGIVDDCIETINAIGEVAYNDESKGKIAQARIQYQALNEVMAGMVSNYETLTNAEARYAELELNDNNASQVVSAIDSIGDVTLDSKAKIDEVRSSYDALTDYEKTLVSNYETLTNAEAAYNELRQNKDVAITVEDAISAIGDVEYTEESKAKIDAARSQFDALTDLQKELVSNYELLVNAEARYEELVNDKNLALETEQLINDIGTVTIDSKEKIEAARAKYDSLSGVQQILVSNYETLTKAEKRLADIQSDKSKADEVDAKIDAIGALAYTSECKEKIGVAKAAYNVLTEEQKAFVTKLDVLNKASKSYDNIDYAYKLINNIGTVELNSESKGKIDNAQKVYNELTDEEKALVTNSNKLTNADTEYKNLSQENAAKIFRTIVIILAIAVVAIFVICYLLLFFVFNSWTLVKYKQKRVFKIGRKDGKVRLLCMNFRIVYRDEVDIHKSKN